MSDYDRNEKESKIFNDFKVNSSRNNELFSQAVDGEEGGNEK